MSARPHCDTCNKPVDEFREMRDTHLGRITWTAKCHGAIEKVEASEAEMSSVKSVTFTRAFLRPRGLLA